MLEEDIVGSAPGVAYNVNKQFCEMACKFRHKNFWLAYSSNWWGGILRGCLSLHPPNIPYSRFPGECRKKLDSDRAGALGAKFILKGKGLIPIRYG